MNELCAWDLDGTIRAGSLLGDAIRHGVDEGFMNPEDFSSIHHPTYDDADVFLAALLRQSRRRFHGLADRLTDEAAQHAYPWAVEELSTQHGDKHAVIFSHSPDFLVRAFARGLPHVRRGRGSYFHTRDLEFSGRASLLNKTRALSRYARENNATITFAAGDSTYDLPMLRRATQRAVVVNPDSDLAAIAEERGWEVVRTEAGLA